ncbi:hypothetical protein [Streptomyces sp. NPDC000880]
MDGFSAATHLTSSGLRVICLSNHTGIAADHITATALAELGRHPDATQVRPCPEPFSIALPHHASHPRFPPQQRHTAHPAGHVRRLPGRTRHRPPLALPHLLAQCGTQPERWHALLKALDYGPTDEQITFERLLDSIQDLQTDD